MQPTQPQLTQANATEIELLAAGAFQPRTPISTRELFAGRWAQITTLADAVLQAGLHVVIHGERGVGKTSLSNIVRPVIRVFDERANLAEERLVIKVNAHSEDTFASLWKKVFDEISWKENRGAIGFDRVPTQGRVGLRDALGLPENLGVDDVRRTLTLMPGAVFIIDEFDRASEQASVPMTDLIKALSDFSVDCTVMIVGVSDTVDTLIANHASIGRALVEINLPRMTNDELRDILKKAEDALNMTIHEDAATLIVRISQGLPHYTHLLGLHSVRLAARRLSPHIENRDVYESLNQAVAQAQQSVTEKHSRATHSAHPDALYRHVLLACAIVASKNTDPLGYFYPAAVSKPLAAILDRPDVQIATFNGHLVEFTNERRARVLERVGQQRSYRFRFSDPLLVPFALMDAITSGIVTSERLEHLLIDPAT